MTAYFDIYISSLYYCIVVLTTVGYGDITSSNMVERIFTIIWMLVGIGFYSYTISTITEFFTQRESRKNLLLKKRQFFNNITSEKGLDVSL